MENKELMILADEEIVALAQNGNKSAYEFLIDKYKSLARVKAQTYFIIGGDHDDVIQEGMIGIFKAIRDFDVEKNASFKTFAELCVTRQIITAIQKANRQKYQILNESVSLSAGGGGEDPEEQFNKMVLAVTSLEENPENMILMKEVFNIIKENEKTLFSPMEIQVWHEILGGRDYKEIAEKLGKEPKNIDNAIQRIKKKVRGYL